MKHVLAVIFAAILFMSPRLSQLEASPASRDSSLKIGFVLPLSGDWAFLGNGIRDGAILASEDLKAHGVDAKLIFMDNRGTTDFRSLLIRMRRVKPDSLLLLGLSPEIELLARQTRELGINIPLTSIESFGLAADKHAFEGSWFIDAAVPSESFQERFLNKYGREVTAGVGHAYDSVMLLGEAFRSAERSGTSLSQALTKISDYRGTIGNLSVKKDGVIWGEASVKGIRDGRVVGVR
jgi:branched-chain amino acid transport system substrate-binding protein